MTETKAKIDLNAGTIELEGSEEFVRSYLDEFKELIKTGHQSKRSAPESLPPDSELEPQQNPAKPKARAKTKAKAKAPTTPKKATAKKLQAERFEIHGDGNEIPALEAFFEQKKPGSANDQRVAVIGFYITELLGLEYFSEGQVEYAYKMLKLDRPGNLHQILLNGKNRKDLFDSNSDDNTKWALTRAGDILVNDKLPPNED